ncbi:tRNA preQ1(34) S-adenosylmethionine ribosyltransferase-isomerase QueA [Thermoproteota archaeon]
MLTETFNYHLPEALIAQEPETERDKSRLLVLNKVSGSITHRLFSDLPNYLRPGDVLVLNNTKVIRARLFGRRESGAQIEIFLLKQINSREWTVLLRPSRRVKEGEFLTISQKLSCKIIKKYHTPDHHIVEFTHSEPIFDLIETHGRVPLPPYIRSSKTEVSNQFAKQYQTVYAEIPGSVAAPTAGLHFTNDLLTRIKSMGVHITHVTLHVGYDTFKPVTARYVHEHKMHSETYEISETSAELLNQAKKNQNRIISVGTTTARALESCISNNKFQHGVNETDIFIYPGYSFKGIDGLLTNFHLPKSSLLMLVSAFASKPFIDSAYQEAITQKYRFFSFGDAMFIEP